MGMKAKIPIHVVYVWEVPVRFFHWINAACILVLCLTGYVIGDPPAIMSGQEAYHSFWFGKVRFVHMAAGYIFTFNILFRIYWSIVGNKFANWRNFIPMTKAQWVEVIDVIKVDMLQVVEKPIKAVGHNAMANITYLVLFAVSFFQLATGFSLMAPTSEFFIPDMFAWVIPFLGNDMTVRFYHHAAMWFFILFTLVHVYLVFYHDYIEGKGVLSSIVGGWKFVEDDPADK